MDVTPQDIFQFTLPPPSSTILPSEANYNPSPRRKLKSSRSSSLSNKKSKKDDQKNNNYSDELEKYTLKALRGESLANCDLKLFPLIISSLEEQKSSYMERNMHDEVQNTFKAIKFTKKAEKDANILLLQKKMKQNLINRRKEAFNELNTLNDRTKQIELNMILTFRNQFINLEQKHKKEIERFENQWTSADKQRMYNKTSSELQELRRQEDLYLEQRFYEDSISAKKKADKIEKYEIQNAMEQMSFDYRTAFAPIKVQQEQELKILKKAQEDEERIFNSTKKKEIDLILKKIKKIEIELENLNDLSYVERILLHSKTHETPANIDFTNSLQNSLSLQDQKRIAVNEFNTLTTTPLIFTKQKKQSSSRRSLIRSPRANPNRVSQKTTK